MEFRQEPQQANNWGLRLKLLAGISEKMGIALVPP